MSNEFTIGILRETQETPDPRTPLTPHGAMTLLNSNKSLKILFQPSDFRAFKNEEFMEAGCILSEDLRDCDLLLGVKEVSPNTLLEGKKYMFFSHTAKKQEHNQLLLQTIIDKNITLIDYEFLYNSQKKRIAAFGYWAGLAGAYSVMRAYGLRYKLFKIKALTEIKSKDMLFKELKKVVGGHEKIVITGNGRVTSGVEEVLQACGIYKVNMDGFFNKKYTDPVYFIAEPEHYVKHKQGRDFVFKEFKKQPQMFESNFKRFTQVADVMIVGHFWDPESPKLFDAEDMVSDLFSIKLIGDITCDIDGSVPTTQRVCSLEEPYYDYNPKTGQLEKPFMADNNITVMAVDKLPGALPRESSEYFSELLVNHVLGYFWMGDYNKVLKKATIAKNGKIKKRYSYLRTFVQEKL